MPFLLVQEAGEAAGLWRPGENCEDRRSGYERLMAFVQEIATASTLPVIDPYGLFFELPGDLPPHWSSVPEWNYTGHRLAGEEASKVLLRSLPPHRQPD